MNRVLFVSPEIPPWVKSGGLGDVTAALPSALRAGGVDTRVLAPGYGVAVDALPGATCIAEFAPYAGFPACRLLDAGDVNGAPLLLLDCPTYFRRPGTAYQDLSFIDWPDNHLRFGLLSRIAALLSGAQSPLAWQPDVMQCNDWPTGLAPAYLQLEPGPRAASVITIHNLSHQGVFNASTMGPLGLPAAMFSMNGVEYYGKLSFLKAGLFYAQRLITVSPTYAREIQTATGGQGLGGLLHARQRELIGILNGIDVKIWNPATDEQIAHRYDFASIDNKSVNKLALQRRMGLELDHDRMLLGVVSRLAHQKGIDWVLALPPAIQELPVQLVVLGSGEKPLEAGLTALARAHPDRVATMIGFDEALAHLIEAGSDAFLMPSRFEPCGLNQMYSLRYGTPPIVRATGGLADTVVDCNAQSMATDTGNGFSFVEPSAIALEQTVRRALPVWQDRTSWRALQKRGMSLDWSWFASAQRYLSVYKAAVGAAEL